VAVDFVERADAGGDDDARVVEVGVAALQASSSAPVRPSLREDFERRPRLKSWRAVSS
jgi:hypothetical protein